MPTVLNAFSWLSLLFAVISFPTLTSIIMKVTPFLMTTPLPPYHSLNDENEALPSLSASTTPTMDVEERDYWKTNKVIEQALPVLENQQGRSQQKVPCPKCGIVEAVLDEEQSRAERGDLPEGLAGVTLATCHQCYHQFEVVTHRQAVQSLRHWFGFPNGSALIGGR